jgi:hypothetical protein
MLIYAVLSIGSGWLAESANLVEPEKPQTRTNFICSVQHFTGAYYYYYDDSKCLHAVKRMRI